MFRRASINKREWFRHSWRNLMQTILLLGFLGGYIMLLGQLIWGSAVTVWMLALVGAFLLVPAGSPQLWRKLYNAQPLSRNQAPEIYHLLEQLAVRAELKKVPAIYYLPMQQPNAMAVGNGEAPMIGISEGLLRLLNRRELAGVLAHEISHLRNGDIRIMQLADMAARLTSSLSWLGLILLALNLPLVLFSDLNINWLLVLILLFAPQLSTLAQLELSRVREYNADLGAATLTEDPAGLASALQKIEQRTGGFFRRLLPGHTTSAWLRTHPPTQERIKRLLKLSEQTVSAPAWRVQPAYRQPIIPQPAKIIHLNPYRSRFDSFNYRNIGWYD